MEEKEVERRVQPICFLKWGVGSSEQWVHGVPLYTESTTSLSSKAPYTETCEEP